MAATCAAEAPTLHLTKVGVLARAGHEAKLDGARITGSNAGATTDFEPQAKLSAPAAPWQQGVMNHLAYTEVVRKS